MTKFLKKRGEEWNEWINSVDQVKSIPLQWVFWVTMKRKFYDIGCMDLVTQPLRHTAQ